MTQPRFQKILSGILLVLIAVAIAIAATTSDPTLRQSIQSSLISETLIFKMKSLAVFILLFFVYRLARHLSREKTKSLESLARSVSAAINQKLNFKQTLLVILWMFAFLSISLVYRTQIGVLPGYLLSFLWFAILLIPLYFLRSGNTKRSTP